MKTIKRLALSGALAIALVSASETANAVTINVALPGAGPTDYSFQISGLTQPFTQVSAMLTYGNNFSCTIPANGPIPAGCSFQQTSSSLTNSGSFLNPLSFATGSRNASSACNATDSSCQRFDFGGATVSAQLAASTELFQFTGFLSGQYNNAVLTLFVNDNNAQVVQLAGPGTPTTGGTDVPLPAGVVLLMSGLAGLVGGARRAKKRKTA